MQTGNGFPAATTATPPAPDQASADAGASPSPGDPRLRPPAISLPTGGGAIRGIGEKLGIAAATGSGTLTIPLGLTPGRAGFGPTLSLAYGSTAGNGTFGLGWSLDLSMISRKTDTGLPRYRDSPDVDDAESDVFVWSGSEDLVPAFRCGDDGVVIRDDDGSPHQDFDERDGYRVVRYRPRTEVTFARIERWSSLTDPEDVFWRTISGDNVLATYGRDATAKVRDPGDHRRVFSWLIDGSTDALGNAMRYEYKAEDDAGATERGGAEVGRGTAQRYLKRIRYGNRISRLDPDHGDADDPDWAFEVVFDYGEGHVVEEPLDPAVAPDDQHRYWRAAASSAGEWPLRPDPFSTYRPGFEVRTRRRCRRVLMFHRFAELGPEPCLVRSIDFDYADSATADPAEAMAHNGSTRFGSLLVAATVRGHRPTGDAVPAGPHGEAYVRLLTAAPPPLELGYRRGVPGTRVGIVEQQGSPSPMSGTAGGQWVDLDGEALPGLLTEVAGAWFYRRNLGDGRLAAAEPLASRPTLGLAGRRLLDLGGDGSLDLVDFAASSPGFSERTPERGWTAFRPFRSLPNLDWSDPDQHLADLTGDGLADVVVSAGDRWRWYHSLGEDGFDAPELVPAPGEQTSGPLLLSTDREAAVLLADLGGDGLPDVVRIGNGEISYWPNLGYGRFGGRIAMAEAPALDAPDGFDPRRVLLADLDGSGVADLLYRGADGLRAYLNASGNGWSGALTLHAFPRDAAENPATVDLLGTGTTCLVWSASAAADAPLAYLEPVSGGKPNLLVSADNNLGRITTIEYTTSTACYLRDAAAGRPWLTRLPFPVQVVERMIDSDLIGRRTLTTRFAYHHGHFDGVEREFAGFAAVDQWDADEFAGTPGAGDASFSLPPVLTRTWYHTGVQLGRDRLERLLAAEYYAGPAGTNLLPDTVLPAGLSAGAEREACRALRGSLLRQEVYGLDGSAAEPHPYLVTEQNSTVRQLQEPTGRRPGVWLTHPRESLRQHHERRPDDPRVQHEITLEVNPFGQVTRSASIGYGRRQPDPSLPPEVRLAQAGLLATVTETVHTNALRDPSLHPDDHRLPAVCETSTWEFVELALDAGRPVLSFAAVAAAVAAASRLQPTDPHTAAALGLVELSRTRFRRDDLTGPADWGLIEARGLPYETYRLAFTAALLDQTYRRGHGAGEERLLPDPVAVLGGTGADAGGYVDLDGDGAWWLPSGQIAYAADGDELGAALRHFFVARRFRSPFASPAGPVETVVDYDPADLHPVRTLDPLGNEVTADLDYRVMAPRRIVDANGAGTQAAFDALGLVTATAQAGLDGAGDDLLGLVEDLTPGAVQTLLTDPPGGAAAALGRAGTRIVSDTGAFQRTRDQAQPTPCAVLSLARESHVSDLGAGQQTAIRAIVAHSDGFAREIQRKLPAEPAPDGSARWIGSGWSVLDNKGRPVEVYEPFASATPAFEFAPLTGISQTLFRDPLGRVVATVQPDQSWAKCTFDAWLQLDYDGNDTCAAHGSLTGDPRTDPDVGPVVAAWFALQGPGWQTWAAQRLDGAAGPAEREAAQRAVAHADTPTATVLDALGRTCLVRAHNGFDAGGQPILLDRRMLLDITGATTAVFDALGRTVETGTHDLTGSSTRSASLDSGQRWTLADVAGHVIRAWDSRGHVFRTEHDLLRRPVRHWVQGADPARSDPATLAGPLLFHTLEYGESQPDDRVRNLRGRLFRTRDGSGTITQGYDFKGNPTTRLLEVAATWDDAIDWSLAQPPGEEFADLTRFDALNRPVQLVAPHPAGDDSDVVVSQPRYNEAGLLDALDVWLGRDGVPAALIDPLTEPPSAAGVDDVDYDVRGQRTRIAYRNGVVTHYGYDPQTFRLRSLVTTRPAPFADTAQDLSYSYDPVGNVSAIADAAQQAVFFRNQVVGADGDFRYDPLYRLVQATGREHVGTAGAVASASSHDDWSRLAQPHPADGAALARYCETYDYDPTGNLLAVRHLDRCPGAESWVRSFEFSEPSRIEDGTDGGAPRVGNRLTGATVGARTDTFSTGGDGWDDHGNQLRMPHLPLIRWDFRDRMVATRRQALAADDPDGVARDGALTHYVYDAAGVRRRKVTRNAAGQVTEDRLYLGGIELYRKVSGSNAGLVRTTVHLADDARRIALVELRNGVDDGTPAQVVRYQLANHLGSAVLELAQDAALIGYEEFSPYGSTTFQAVGSVIEVSARRYRYTGRERDEESGLAYHGARYYAPWLGRWISADPAGLSAGPNLYRYCDDNPLTLSDPNGTDPDEAEKPLFQLRPLLTDVGVDGISGPLRVHNPFSSDRSISGRVGLAGHGRASFQLDVPRLGLHIPGLADLSGAAAVDTGIGRAGLRLQGGALLGDASGLNLGLRGSGSFRIPVPGELRIADLPGSLLARLPQGEGDLTISGALSLGTFSLATLNGRATVADGRFEGSLSANGAFDLARARLDASGRLGDDGRVTLDAGRLSARAGIPGFGLTLNATGTGDGSGGLGLRGSGDLTLFGLPSLHADATGSASSEGVDLAARFSGAGPLFTSYITGSARFSSTSGLSGQAGIFGLTYTPGISLTDPSPPSASSKAVLGAPRNPWTPSGLTIGASYFGYRQGLLYHISGGFMPDLSERIFTNPRVGVTAAWHF